MARIGYCITSRPGVQGRDPPSQHGHARPLYFSGTLSHGPGPGSGSGSGAGSGSASDAGTGSREGSSTGSGAGAGTQTLWLWGRRFGGATVSMRRVPDWQTMSCAQHLPNTKRSATRSILLLSLSPHMGAADRAIPSGPPCAVRAILVHAPPAVQGGKGTA